MKTKSEKQKDALTKAENQLHEWTGFREFLQIQSPFVVEPFAEETRLQFEAGQLRKKLGLGIS